ncbi:MAG: hypothetical protein QOJ63_3751 [Solirubrobacteraceae bacterium]|nr:hypothetical protein [Solirubrobacteraceae bacterium]
MRVTHVISTPTGVGGAERTLSDLVALGASKGWDQLVLNPFALDPDADELSALYAPASYEGRRCRGVRGLPALRSWLSRRVAAFQPDVVHAHLFHASVMVASLRRPRDSAFVLSHQHGDKFQVGRSRLLELADRIAVRHFDQVVGCSQSVADYLLYRYGLAPTRVSYVRNGWSGRPRPPSADPLGQRVICVAHLSAQKNHRVLIEAIAKVRERASDVCLQLVGDGADRAELEAYARRRGLEDSVEFLGRVDDVWPLLAEAHVFVLASLYEPLGIAALEAMAAGLPVVASSVGGLREIVRDGTTGYLVPPGDAELLAARIAELLGDRQLASTMGLRGREVAEEYRSERMAEGYARVYEGLTHRASPSAAARHAPVC